MTRWQYKKEPIGMQGIYNKWLFIESKANKHGTFFTHFKNRKELMMLFTQRMQGIDRNDVN